VQLVVDDPDVLLRVVGTDLDLVRSAAAGTLLEQLIEVRPLVDECALPVENQDRMLESPLPSPLLGRFARC
jgi:hypothetical protein